MAKQGHNHMKAASPRLFKSNSEIERSCIVAKKLLRYFDINPNLLDVFSKKQKQYLFSLFPVEFPSLKAEKENTVPRRYIDKIRTDMLQFMKTNYLGDPENKITLMDLTMYGLTFYYSILELTKINWFTGDIQVETAKLISDKFNKVTLTGTDGYGALQAFLFYETRSYSQVNFRLYGFNCELELVPPKTLENRLTSIRLKIQLTVRNCETKVFAHNNIKRKAFRMIYMPVGGENDHSRGAVIRRRKFFPKAFINKKYNIYIQSHVLHRFKERIDIFEPTHRNVFIQKALIFEQIVVPFEKQFLLSCTIDGTLPIGYFTYFISDSDLVINTFLPLTSEGTPEGESLRKLLPLNKEDYNYLGMDKISFYSTIDFEQIPVLKDALISSGIWKTKIAIDDMYDDELLEKEPPSIDMNKTMFVKKYFDKLEQYRTDM